MYHACQCLRLPHTTRYSATLVLDPATPTTQYLPHSQNFSPCHGSWNLLIKLRRFAPDFCVDQPVVHFFLRMIDHLNKPMHRAQPLATGSDSARETISRSASGIQRNPSLYIHPFLSPGKGLVPIIPHALHLSAHAKGQAKPVLNKMLH